MQTSENPFGSPFEVIPFQDNFTQPQNFAPTTSLRAPQSVSLQPLPPTTAHVETVCAFDLGDIRGFTCAPPGVTSVQHPPRHQQILLSVLFLLNTISQLNPPIFNHLPEHQIILLSVLFLLKIILQLNPLIYNIHQHILLSVVFILKTIPQLNPPIFSIIQRHQHILLTELFLLKTIS